MFPNRLTFYFRYRISGDTSVKIYSGIDFEYWFTADMKKLEKSITNKGVDFSNLVFSRDRLEKFLFSKNKKI